MVVHGGLSKFQASDLLGIYFRWFLHRYFDCIIVREENNFPSNFFFELLFYFRVRGMYESSSNSVE